MPRDSFILRKAACGLLLSLVVFVLSTALLCPLFFLHCSLLSLVSRRIRISGTGVQRGIGRTLKSRLLLLSQSRGPPLRLLFSLPLQSMQQDVPTTSCSHYVHLQKTTGFLSGLCSVKIEIAGLVRWLSR